MQDFEDQGDGSDADGVMSSRSGGEGDERVSLQFESGREQMKDIEVLQVMYSPRQSQTQVPSLTMVGRSGIMLGLVATINGR